MPRPARTTRGPGAVAILPGVGARLDPRSWSLCDDPAPVPVLVLAVDALAVVLAVVAGAGEPVRTGDPGTFALLALGAVVHHEVSRHVERLRDVDADGRAYVDLTSMWTFAGLLLLPIGLAVALVVVTFAYFWLRASRRPVPHRWVFSAAAVVVATVAAQMLLLRLPGGPAGTPWPARGRCWG